MQLRLLGWSCPHVEVLGCCPYPDSLQPECTAVLPGRVPSIQDGAVALCGPPGLWSGG